MPITSASVLDYLMQCESLGPADLRPLLTLAESTADAEIKRSPDDRDAVMRQGAVYTALASKLPEGPEKKAAEARSNARFDRFMEMDPDRKRALQGEPPEDLYSAFSYQDPGGQRIGRVPQAGPRTAVCRVAAEGRAPASQALRWPARRLPVVRRGGRQVVEVASRVLVGGRECEPPLGERRCVRLETE